MPAIFTLTGEYAGVSLMGSYSSCCDAEAAFTELTLDPRVTALRLAYGRKLIRRWDRPSVKGA